jgi:hypothetical protein
MMKSFGDEIFWQHWNLVFYIYQNMKLPLFQLNNNKKNLKIWKQPPSHTSLLIFNHVIFLCLKKRKKMNKHPDVSLILFAFKDI